MRRERHGVVRYLKSVLPVPQFDYSADTSFGCDGAEAFGKVFAMEILATHMCAFETRVDVEEEIDIKCPSWIAEKFISQLLPRALPRYVVDGVVDFPSPAKASAWLEDMDTYSRIVLREIEAYMQDLPDAWRFNESLHRDILQTYFNIAKEVVCVKLECSTNPQVQYVIEPGPYSIPVARDGGCKNGNSVLQTLLDDAVSNSENAKSVHLSPVKTFELKPLVQDSLLEQHSGQSRNRELEEYTKTIDIVNLVGRVGGSEVEEPVSKLLDFDPADFLLEKFHSRETIVQQKLQSGSSTLYEISGLSLLDENSVAADMSVVTKRATKFVFELPEVLEHEHLDSLLTLKRGTCISTLMKPNPVELEVLESREIAFQDFEKLVVLPELTLETSRFHFLQVPSFVSEHQTRISEDVFKVLFRAKALPSSISASDWLYLDWHLSQVGHCNNFGCFHFQRTAMRSELRVTLQRDMVLREGMPEHLMLLSLAEDSLPWQYAETECGNKKEVYPAAYLHASVSNPMFNFSSFVYKAVKAVDKNISHQSVLTLEPRNNFPSVRGQVPLAGSGLASMDTVLSLMKQARQGDLSRDAKSMQVSENELYQEGYQGIGNTKNEFHDQTPEEYQVFELSPMAVKIATPNALSSSDGDAAFSYNLLSSNYVDPELQVPLYTSACPSNELPQMGIKPALQPAYEESSPQQSEVDDLVQLSNGQGQGPHLIVVANIMQPRESILLQRRSSYQKILGLENEDLQVVERELNLPVDLILNPSTCLTVYTEDKLLRCAKRLNPNSEEFFSCAIDRIIDCHMKALSFSFQRWFMIFEGELACNSASVHILNKLYISSAGFQMRLQVFISANSIATDSLVLRCIKKTWKMSKRHFNSPMSEDLTDGEVCLATFPSLNPVSSQAILCLKVPIATFISWSHEEQKCALQDFDVRAESLNLLTAQVLYGKLETSDHRGIFSECPWPAASEIVAPEVGGHVQAGFTYFPPASEITGCELEGDFHGVPPREGHSNPYSPACPDPTVPYDSAEQGTSTWNGVCWPNDDAEPVTFAHHATHSTQQPNCLEENYGCYNQVDVHGMLQQWIRKRNVNHSEPGSEDYRDSFKFPNNNPYRERPCLNRLPTSVECTTNAVYPTSRHEANDELRRAPSLKTSGKRTVSDMEQFCHQGGVSPALQSHKKKLNPANRSRDKGPSSQLGHSLKMSRQSCYKFSAPFGRTI